MDSLYIPPLPETVLPPLPPVQLSPEEKRRQQLIKILFTAGSALRKILKGLERIIEDVAESIMRR